EQIIDQTREYSAFVDASTDALTYVWHTLWQLIGLASTVRVTGQFIGEPIRITDDDIVGEIRSGP
ncbi:MAG: hypothetical protein AAFY42_14600, partial [Pseudomonadota bacterium]